MRAILLLPAVECAVSVSIPSPSPQRTSPRRFKIATAKGEFDLSL
jgi:hypothetical protein